jgi:S-DNA-T family DNA segregation ATPase FtsK/SpoIIIE
MGAYVSDLFLQTFALAAFALPVLLACWGIQYVWFYGVQLWWLRITTTCIMLIAGGAFFASLGASELWVLGEYGLGGALGKLIHNLLAPIITPYALAATSLVVALTAFYLACALSKLQWIAIGAGAGWIGMHVKKLFALLKHAISGEMVTVEAKKTTKVRREEPKLKSSAKKRSRTILTAPSNQKLKERQASLDLKRKDEFELPPLSLLNELPKKVRPTLSEEALNHNAQLLESVLKDFGVNGEIVKIRPGPVVTLYELEPSPGTKSSRVVGLADDIARSMSAVSARIAVIPGRNAIGIELPNTKRETVFLRELLEDPLYIRTEAKLPLAMGKDIGGDSVIVDLARMPHLLVAGTTGSGKSVAINTMIMSLVYRLSPEECKFIMIDPKMLELSIYDDIPHLLTPVVTEPGKAVVALKWTVREMENRYRLMSNLNVRNVESYNKRLAEARKKGEELKRTVQTGFNPDTGQPIYEDQPIDMEPLPFIVVIVDEMADLMLVAGKEIEGSIQRLAQMARAAGIHIIMATQRPSVDVITGVIKANFPTRVSFQVTSRIDSRTILGEQGAEQLLGQGDMLYMAGGGRITRVHGPFASDKEVEMIVKDLKSKGKPNYIESVTQSTEEDGDMFANMVSGFSSGDEEEDRLYDQAVAIVARDRKASTSYIQRCLKIGYNRAARLIDRMEEEGVIGAANHVGKREVLVRDSEEQY